MLAVILLVSSTTDTDLVKEFQRKDSPTTEDLLQIATHYEANNKDRCFITGSKDGPTANVATAGRGKPIAKFNAFFQQLKKEGRCFRCMEKGSPDHKMNCVGLKSTCISCH